MAFKKLAIISLFIFIQVSVSSCVMMADPVTLFDVPQSRDVPLATVTIIRKEQFAGVVAPVFIALDEMPIAKLKNREYTEFQVSIEQHDLQAFSRSHTVIIHPYLLFGPSGDPNYTISSDHHSPKFAAGAHYVFVVSFESMGTGYGLVVKQAGTHDLARLLEGKAFVPTGPRKAE